MSDFLMLDDRTHCLKRPSMYIGSTTYEEHARFVFGKWTKISYVPGLVKIIDEIIDNSVDEAIRTNFEFANAISVDIKDNIVTVTDNGRGIPQHMITTPEGEQVPQPVVAWTRTKAGSNFDDTNRVTQGLNGVGSSLTNFFSAWFMGVTCDGTTEMTVRCTNGAENIQWSTKPGSVKGTKVTFCPEFAHFDGMVMSDTILDVIKDRLMSLSVVFPKIAFKFNGKKVSGKFKTYAEMYGEETIITEGDNYSLALATSPDGFRHMTFVNGLNTKVGGTHIDYVVDGLSDELLTRIKKDYKVEVSKSQIKSGLTCVMVIRNLPNLRFDSQTKDRLTNPLGDIKRHLDIDFKKLARVVSKCEAIIMPIIETVLARKLAAEQAALTKAAKKAAKAKVAKHIKAGAYDSQADTTLFLTEGDSATGYFLKVRDPKLHGCYSLRGKIVNTWGEPEAEIIKNKEIADIMAILGLTFKTSPFNMKSDGAFYEIEVNGETVVANINDEIFVDGEWVEVSEIVKGK